MPRRLKVLMSAYACEPHRGSEPEVGWRWALEMAKHHEITVLTRANNRAVIEAAVGESAQPRFVYHDLGAAARRWKKRLQGSQLYYARWQQTARRRVAELVASEGFDLLHHTTFAGYRFPIAIAGHGVPSLWGPVGGVEVIPLGLLPWRHLPSLLRESLRNALNLAQTQRWSGLAKRTSAVTRTLASTREMQDVLKSLGRAADLMPTIGIDGTRRAVPIRTTHSGPLRLLYVGSLIALKGIDLAIEALHHSKTNAILTLVGEGNFSGTCRKLARRLGLADRVIFAGQRPRSEVLGMYCDFDLVMFPSLHDTGGYPVLEGFANGLPTICLDCGGPALAVDESCGIKVQPGRRRQVIAGLSEAIRTYDQDRALLIQQAAAAHRVVAQRYDWERKGERMSKLYAELVGAC